MVYLKKYHTKGSLGTGNCCGEAKLSPGPPDPGLDGLRAAVIDYWGRRSSEEKSGGRLRWSDTKILHLKFIYCYEATKIRIKFHSDKILTFTAVSRDLSERVVTAVTLASDHARLTLTLAALSVTRSGEGANRVAVTQQAGVAALGAVMVVLVTGSGRKKCWF